MQVEAAAATAVAHAMVVMPRAAAAGISAMGAMRPVAQVEISVMAVMHLVVQAVTLLVAKAVSNMPIVLCVMIVHQCVRRALVAQTKYAVIKAVVMAVNAVAALVSVMVAVSAASRHAAMIVRIARSIRPALKAVATLVAPTARPIKASAASTVTSVLLIRAVQLMVSVTAAVKSAALRHAAMIARNVRSTHLAQKAVATLVAPTVRPIKASAASTVMSVLLIRVAQVKVSVTAAVTSAVLHPAAMIARTAHSVLKAAVTLVARQLAALIAPKVIAAAPQVALAAMADVVTAVGAISAVMATVQQAVRSIAVIARTSEAGAMSAVVKSVTSPVRLFPSPSAVLRRVSALTVPLRMARIVRFPSSARQRCKATRTSVREQSASTSASPTWACAHAAKPMSGWKTAGYV